MFFKKRKVPKMYVLSKLHRKTHIHFVYALFTGNNNNNMEMKATNSIPHFCLENVELR